MKRAGVVLSGALIVLGTSCGLFEARKPNEPTGVQFQCLPLDQQLNIFQNVLNAYGVGEGLSCYSSTLDPAFAFVADPADVAEAPAGQYDSWNKSVEERVSQNLVSGAQAFQLRITAPVDTVSITPGSEEIRRYTYEIDFRGTLIPDTLFQGTAEITIRLTTGGQWQITNWVDRRDPGGTTTRTWGYLRGAFRIGI